MTVIKSFDFTHPLGNYKVNFHRLPAVEVALISYSTAPEDLVHLTTRGYKGIYHWDPEYRKEEYTREQAFEDITKTKLQTPYEMLHTTWLFMNVTRAFTHQLVRYRIGTAFVQESMRFFGIRKEFNILATHGATVDDRESRNSAFLNVFRTPFDAYAEGCCMAVQSYMDLLSDGAEDQDARGVLPTNILTNIYADLSLRTLALIITQRMCCQAQPGEWQLLINEMRSMLNDTMGPRITDLLRAPYERGEDCGYRASFDRPCIWQQDK